MKKTVSLLLVLVFSITLLSTAWADEIVNTEPTEPSFVMTNNGGILGVKYDGVERYLGIPYAKAERFMLPEEVSWEGYRSCLTYGAVSPQESTMSDSTVSMWNLAETTGEMVSNEDCLNLNIWTTDSKTSELKPVIFWLHGGGYSSGSSHELTFYEGANLAKYGDVVFVSVNTRLNVLGFLDLSAYGEEYKYSGNAGTADMVAALEWVHRNISAFGGDPENVTIIGQSGGGSKVTTLMGLPAAKGLFQKAVIQSGGTTQTTRTTETAQAEAAAVVEALGLTAETIDQIKTIHYDQLMAAATQAKVSFGPVVDGDYYPDGTFEMSKDIPIMCGNVQAELFAANTIGIWYYNYIQTPYPTEESLYERLISNQTDEYIDAAYAAKYGDSAEAIKAEFAAVYPTHNVAEGVNVNDRGGASLGVQLIAKKMAEYGGTAYNYLDVYTYPMFGGVVAVHTNSDIPFFFRNLDKMEIYIAGDEVNAYALQDVMSNALLNFARTGNPSQEGLEWEAYTEENGACMVFDSVSELRYHHDDKLLELIRNASGSAW